MKMLLVGELNETLYSLNQYLSKSFQIQMCSESDENVKDMVRILRPSIIVLNVSEIKEDVTAIFEMLSKKLSSIPMVVIGTLAMKDELMYQLRKFKNAVVLTRPLNASEVLKACNELLSIDDNESIFDNKEGFPKEKKSILVVDDNALTLRRMKQLLESDYQVVLANSGEKALELLKKKTINLILLDYEMPGMDGRQVFEAVIGDDETKDIPVVFLTSVAQKDQIFDVLVNRPFGYILKPPSNDKILSIIEEAFEEE